MTELLPKPKPSDYNGIDHDLYVYVFNNDRDCTAYNAALLAYYKRLAEFAVANLDVIYRNAFTAQTLREIAEQALSTIKQSEQS